MLFYYNSTDLTINHFCATIYTSKQLNESLKMATYKQIFDQLQRKVTMDLNATDEQIEMVIKLRQSFETDEERAKRIAHFKSLVNTTND